MTTRVVPWIRSGLSTAITTAADAGVANNVRALATVALDVTANGGEHTVSAGSKSIEMYGPGDVVGLDEAQIRNLYPRPGAPDAEWNYFPYVELVDADMPWRYSPAGPDANDIAPPWLTLVVIEEDVEGTFSETARLPELFVDSADSLPDPTELWAWAHAFGTGDPVADVASFNARLLCPRRLRPSSAWRACVVPAFMTGRNAGLGHPPGTDSGPAWTAGATEITLPVYFSWTFRTGENDGTFLQLAQRLTPRELSPDVGVRPIELDQPGAPLPAHPGASADFVGAMFSPAYDAKPSKPDVLDALGESYVDQLTAETPGPADDDAYDPLVHDPVVRLPRYGSPQRRGEPLPTTPEHADHWYRKVSTDPTHRSVAALGASVVRNDQEALMSAAWDHAASLTVINESLQRARLASEIAQQRRTKFSALHDAQRLQVIGPATGRVRHGDMHLHAELERAQISPTVLGGAFRRITRAGGPIQRAITVQPTLEIGLAPNDRFFGTALTSGAAGFITQQPVMPPAGVDVGVRPSATVAEPGTFELGTLESRPHLDHIVDNNPAFETGSLDITWTTPATSVIVARQPLVDSLQSAPILASVATSTPTVAQVVSQQGAVKMTTTKKASSAPLVAKKAAPAKLLAKKTAGLKSSAKKSAKKAVAKKTVGKKAAGTVTGIPTDVVVSTDGPTYAPPPPLPDEPERDFPYQTDAPGIPVVQQIREQILAQTFHLVTERPGDLPQQAIEAAPLPQFDVDVAALMDVAIDPDRQVRNWVNNHIVGPAEADRAPVANESTPIPTALTARPKFELPMYERLRELSVEYVVPGVGLVPKNTVGALSVNTAFVEAFLIGANHEMSREFRWREYPAPLHLTWFDQFWDAGPGGPADIAPIGQWRPTQLGAHATGGDRLVVLVKGELIERFPNVSVYMIEATATGGERTAKQGAATALPQFQGKLQDGVYFYGFKLPGTASWSQTRRAQQGGADGQGWFFALEEQPRAPRFGLNVGTNADVGESPALAQDLSWRHMKLDEHDEPWFVTRAQVPDAVEAREYAAGTWFDNAAAMAGITFRQPSRVLMHATAMLEES